VPRILDVLVEGAGWREFYADRGKPCLFFVEWPDENLVEWPVSMSSHFNRRGAEHN
jgi:hypothetical protein